LPPPNIWQKFGNAPRRATVNHSAPQKAGGAPNRVESTKKEGLRFL
jgi:hypothetical protein